MFVVLVSGRSGIFLHARSKCYAILPAPSYWSCFVSLRSKFSSINVRENDSEKYCFYGLDMSIWVKFMLNHLKHSITARARKTNAKFFASRNPDRIRGLSNVDSNCTRIFWIYSFQNLYVTIWFFLNFFAYSYSMLPQQQLDQLKGFISVIQAKPDLLHTPELSFFKVTDMAKSTKQQNELS